MTLCDDDGHVVVKPNDNTGEVTVDLYGLVAELNERGQDLPMLFRFPDILLQARVWRVCALRLTAPSAKTIIRGATTAIYPIKVNQQESVVKNIIVPKNDEVSIGSSGLQAGIDDRAGGFRPKAAPLCATAIKTANSSASPDRA